MNVREKVLKEALNCVNGEREKQYGSPEDNFRRIADLWSTYLTSLFEDEKVVVDIDPIDVAKMMILFKIARSNGDKDKLDNYVDILGYGACAAEIFEGQERNDIPQKKIEVFPCDHIKVTEECRNCDYAKKCMGTGVCLKEEEKKLLDKRDPYSYAHDKLSNYVSIKAREEHVPLDKLKEVDRRFPRELADYLHDAVNDCVENGKRFLDCYKEIDELFEKYVKSSPYRIKSEDNSFWEIYNRISAHIISTIIGENIDSFDVIERLTRNGHAITEMTTLLLMGKINFDDVDAYIEEAVNEVKNKGDKK